MAQNDSSESILSLLERVWVEAGTYRASCGINVTKIATFIRYLVHKKNQMKLFQNLIIIVSSGNMVQQEPTTFSIKNKVMYIQVMDIVKIFQ